MIREWQDLDASDERDEALMFSMDFMYSYTWRRRPRKWSWRWWRNRIRSVWLTWRERERARTIRGRWERNR